MGDNEVNWINIAVRTAAARLDDKEQAAAVCRYLRGEVEDWKTKAIKASRGNLYLLDEVSYLRGEVEWLEAELALMQIQRDARPKIPIVINSACKHRNMWGDVYDNKRTYRCPDCGLEYDEVTHE